MLLRIETVDDNVTKTKNKHWCCYKNYFRKYTAQNTSSLLSINKASNESLTAP